MHKNLLILFITMPFYCIAEQLHFPPIEEYIENKSVLDYQSFDQLIKRASNLFAQDKYDDAAALYKQALGLNPTCAQAFFNMGQSLYKSKKYTEALNAFKQTLIHKKNHIGAYTQIGSLLIDAQQPADAIAPLNKALSLDQKDSKIRLLIARAYNDQRLFADALEIVTQGLALDPTDINLTFELANIYNTLNRLEESLRIYKELDARAPNNPSIIYNIAFTLKKIGDLEASLPYYNKVLELNPTHAEALFSRGLAYLVIGDFEKGWEGYEWRYSRPSQGSLRSYEQPRWDGSDITGKTILLHAEQGLGDTFQFIRYAKVVKEEKNCTVIVAVQKALVTLMGLCPYIDSVISTEETPPAFDVQAPLMSLPYILKTKIESIPCEIPYVSANENLIEYWKEKLSHDKNFKVGVCWEGNRNYSTPLLRATVALKSIEPEQFAPLCTIPGVSLYNLQKNTTTYQVKNPPKHMNIITFDETFDQEHGSFMDYAAVIKNLDLVITVDTGTCHIASSMGVPTWVMIPNPPDWRWMLNRNDTPWYPDMRLFRQPTPGDWNSVIETITQELQKKVNGK